MKAQLQGSLISANLVLELHYLCLGMWVLCSTACYKHAPSASEVCSVQGCQEQGQFSGESVFVCTLLLMTQLSLHSRKTW